MSEAKIITIRAPGSTEDRVLQACDRCRLKKTKCDGKKPCLNCAGVGLECRVLDRLLRRAFPRGYTETLEERLRQLETENRRLARLVDWKDSQLQATSASSASEGSSDTTTPVYKLQTPAPPHHQGCSCCAPHPSLVSWGRTADLGAARRPTLRAHLLPMIKLESMGLINILPPPLPPPGTNVDLLPRLAAKALPRTTEEQIFTPLMLSKVMQHHGNAVAAGAVAATLAQLKEYPRNHIHTPILWRSVAEGLLLPAAAAAVWRQFQLPPRMIMDLMILRFFSQWNTAFPAVHEPEFQAIYSSAAFTQAFDAGFSDAHGATLQGHEHFGILLVLMCGLGLASGYEEMLALSDDEVLSGANSPFLPREHIRLAIHCEAVVHEFIEGLTALEFEVLWQLLTVQLVALVYVHHVGNVKSISALRLRTVSIAQSLRLHRCPLALYLTQGKVYTPTQQAHLRLMFWTTYALDVYLSMWLGVPRLINDADVENAAPDPSDPNHLNVVYVQLLGRIHDTLMHPGLHLEPAMHWEPHLEAWRRALPAELQFDTDTNGFLHADFAAMLPAKLGTVFAYYRARCLIYWSTLSGLRLPADVPQQQLVVIQQAATQTLAIYVHTNRAGIHIPGAWLPARVIVRHLLLVARGLLDYARTGTLFQDVKRILDETVRLMHRQAHVVSLFNKDDLVFPGVSRLLDQEMVLPGALHLEAYCEFENALAAVLAPVSKGEPVPPTPTADIRNLFTFNDKQRAGTATPPDFLSLWLRGGSGELGFGVDGLNGLNALMRSRPMLPAAHMDKLRELASGVPNGTSSHLMDQLDSLFPEVEEPRVQAVSMTRASSLFSWQGSNDR